MKHLFTRFATVQWIILISNLFLILNARSQLVTDGQTNILDGVTNSINSGSTIGSSGSYTLLVLTNGAVVTNVSGSVIIGANASAQSNRVVITGSNSFWKAASFTLGQGGSASELRILDGAMANGGTGNFGQNATSSNNLVLVSGPGSTWVSGGLFMGGGSANTMVVSNGGHVSGTGATLGSGGSTGSFSNNVQITGIGSEWDSGTTYIGYINSRLNSLIINDSATTVSGALEIGYMANSNRVLISDTGSVLQCQSFRTGHAGIGNECVISNGAQLTIAAYSQTILEEGTLTKIKITGSGSTFTNLGTFSYFGQTSNILEITDGGKLVDNYGYFEKSPGSAGAAAGYDMAIIAGTNSLWQSINHFYVGTLNQQLLVTNGGVLADDFGHIGDISADGTNYVLISGPGSSWINTNDLSVGANGGSCHLYVTNGGTVRANNLNIAGVPNKTEVVVADSGAILLGNSLGIGNLSSKSNKLTVSGGIVIVSNRVSALMYSAINMNSGVFASGSMSMDANGGNGSSMKFNGGSLQLGSTSYPFHDPFTIGDGTNKASFEMITNGVHSFSAGLIVSSNALLKGFGTIVAPNISVNNGGTIMPGNTDIGTIKINGNLTLASGSMTIMKLDSTSGEADNLIGPTAVVYGGTLQLMNSTGPFSAGNFFKLFSATNYLGAFDNIQPAAPGAGLRWDTNELNIDGVLRVVSTITPPPALKTAMTAGGNLLISATGGISYDPCYLLTCTNFPPAPADWKSIATNYFDLTGAAAFTNAIPPVEPQRYFKVQIN